LEHDQLEETHWWFVGRRAIIRHILRRFLAHGDPRRKILDMGCGSGGMLRLLAEVGEPIGLDPSPYAVEPARPKTGCCVECGLLPVPKSFGQENFAVVTAFDVIEHIDDDLAALQSMYGLLRSEGFFVCTVPAFNFLWSEHDNLNHHKRRYTKGELR